MSSEAEVLRSPAQLSFLAIYNPSLGSTDESIHDQIVFYWSHRTRSRRPEKGDDEERTDGEEHDANDKLRQVGLVQGMVDFAK